MYTVPRSPSTVKCIVDGELGNKLGVNDGLICSLPHAIQRPFDEPTSADFKEALRVLRALDCRLNDFTIFSR